MIANVHANSADAELDALVRAVMRSHERAVARRHPGEDAADAISDNVVYPGDWPHNVLDSSPAAADDDAAASAFVTFAASWLKGRADAPLLLKELARRIGDHAEAHAALETPPTTDVAAGGAASPEPEAAADAAQPDREAVDPSPQPDPEPPPSETGADGDD